MLVYSLIGCNKVEVALSEGQTQGRRYAEKRGDRHGQRSGRRLRRAEQARRDDGHLVHQGRRLRRHADGRFRDAMAAKMPGVQVLTLGGQPDGNVSIRIRGIQSATSGNDPLYVIDGVPCDARAFRTSKAATSRASKCSKMPRRRRSTVRAARAASSLITTKRGEGERPVVSYDGQFSVSSVSKTIDMLNAYEFAKIFKEARDGATCSTFPTGSIDDPYEDRPQTYHRVDPLITAYLQDKTGTMTDTDWQDAIFRTAYSTKHSCIGLGPHQDAGLLHRRQLPLPRGNDHRVGFRTLQPAGQHRRQAQPAEIRRQLLALLLEDQLHLL